jgi:excisionase family DNA binding protein
LNTVENMPQRLCIPVPEAARLLSISRNYAYELVRRGELPATRFGKRILIPRALLEKRIEQEANRERTHQETR